MRASFTSDSDAARYTRRESFGALFFAALQTRSAATAGPAFHYQAIFSRESEEWYTRFPILVTGGILSEKQSVNLRLKGAKLLAYSWSSGFYPGDEVSATLEWQAMVQQHRAEWLLNKAPLGGGAAASGRVAEWYDYGEPDLVTRLAAHLAGRLSEAGYDGFFFDTLGAEHLPPPALGEFRSRHADTDYDAAQGLFLRELRKQLSPRALIFTNQAYRHPAALLPCADLDLTESYFTAVNASGGTTIRKWNDSRAPWDGVKIPVEKLVIPAGSRFPRVRFVHLNYAAGSAAEIRRAISYSYACAKLFNHDAYLVAPGSEPSERDEIYFSDLGQPVSRSYLESADGTVAWREYKKGIVAINSGPAAAVIPGHSLKLPDPPRGYVFR